jgi:uncharacterized membrane protein YphA (DoxX/SURF4 family)
MPYSKFPGGLPGVALILLRISTTATSIVSACGSYHDRPTWYLWALVPLGAALCAGFLTPLVALLTMAVQMIGFTASGANAAWLGVSLVNTLALALLGPGAYSLDARRFGRRLLLTNRPD